MRNPAACGITCLILGLTLVAYVQAQVNPNEYTEEMALAKRYMQEQRFDEALDALNKAYQAKPENEALIEMGSVFLSEGKGSEALDVFNHVLSEGGEIPFYLQHGHALSSCSGTLYISAQKLRWLNSDKKESFDMPPAQIEKPSTSERKVVGGTGGAPSLVLRVNGKRWGFIYPLYGANGKYHQGSNSIIYSGDELENAKRAHSAIAQLISTAATVKVGPVVAPQANIASAPSITAPASIQKQEVNGVAAASTSELTEGQTPEEVEKILGKTDDIITVKDTLIYIYPTLKVFFENGKLVNVEERKK